MLKWHPWMNDTEFESFMKTGYYSHRVDFINDREVKVISINTLSCDILNKFTFSELEDPNGQLDFLINELNVIEKANG